jgi:O-methyltransferase
MPLNSKVKTMVPARRLRLYRLVRNPRDARSALSFLARNTPGVSLRQRLSIVKKLYVISYNVECTHTQEEMFSFIETILSIPKGLNGCVVEAGSFKGGSTAKFSIAAKMAGRELVVFDSFEGIPENSESHDRNIYGGAARFSKGDYRGSVEEVRSNIAKFGRLEVCRCVKGWFEETLPDFKEPIAAAYLDVDLASSTRSCLKYLYPLLVPGGVLLSQDGHLSLVIDVFGEGGRVSEAECGASGREVNQD